MVSQHQYIGILLLLLAARHYCSGSDRNGDSQTSCTAGTVVEGQPSSVSCQFPHDVAAHRHMVNVLRYDFEGRYYIPELVLKCVWRQGSDTPHCTTSSGFDFDGHLSHLSHTVTVTISNTTKRHTGIYKCDYSLAAPEDLRECKLHVKGTKISCTSSPVSEGETASVTCHFNSNLRETRNNFFVYRTFKTDGKRRHEDVLTCNWDQTDNGRIYCIQRPGFHCNTDDISSEVTIYIPQANHSHAGKYSCDTVPGEHRVVTVDQCEVDVRVRTTTRVLTTTTTARPLTDRQPNSERPKANADLMQTKTRAQPNSESPKANADLMQTKTRAQPNSERPKANANLMQTKTTAQPDKTDPHHVPDGAYSDAVRACPGSFFVIPSVVGTVLSLTAVAK